MYQRPTADQILKRPSKLKYVITTTLQLALVFGILRVIMVIWGMPFIYIPVLDPAISALNTKITAIFERE